uniref:Uncharacterized protein n=1 Tax=Arthrobacter sp. Chr15 TaxID=447032 RepID=A6YFP4_9MICC|nr:unknown [Arthrobacter sp. Chr15]
MIASASSTWHHLRLPIRSSGSPAAPVSCASLSGSDLLGATTPPIYRSLRCTPRRRYMRKTSITPQLGKPANRVTIRRLIFLRIGGTSPY